VKGRVGSGFHKLFCSFQFGKYTRATEIKKTEQGD
jgi:hypothetical protein